MVVQERAEPGPIMCALATGSVVTVLVISLLNHRSCAYRVMDDQKAARGALCTL